MDDYNEFISKQLDFRLTSLRKKILVRKRDLNFQTNIHTLAAFSTVEKRFYPLNGFNNIVPFDLFKDQFSLANRQLIKGRRQARFATLVYKWGIKSVFLTNWCDAQGWNYRKVLDMEHQVPIIQFSRRKSQRDSVILFPLDKTFMGYGGKNLPIINDEKEFSKKENKIVWRGRYSGTLSDEVSYVFWAEGLVQKQGKLSNTEMLRYTQIPRYKFIKAISELNFTDVGFVHSGNELINIQQCSLKSKILLPFLKNKLSIKKQLEFKFIFALPGNDYASSLYWSLMANSVVFMLETEWETALDAGLEPWVHYVPIKLCKNDVQEKYEKMLNDEALCLDIIKNAHAYMGDMTNHDLRDALDYETLKAYQEQVTPLIGLDLGYSFSRGDKYDY